MSYIRKKDQYGHYVGDNHTVVPIRVAGVTFKNGRRHRQTILRQIYWKDEPYNRVDGIDLVSTEVDGAPAVEVWVYNKNVREMIGYVPKEEVDYVHSRIDSYNGYHDLSVYGGGKNEDGTSRSFGAIFYAHFENDPNAIITVEEDKPSDTPVKTANCLSDCSQKPAPKPQIPTPGSRPAYVAPPPQKKERKINYSVWLIIAAIIVWFLLSR